MGRLSREAGMHPPDGPPVWAALNFFPPGTPPPMSKMIRSRVMPMGTSTRPVLLIFPAKAKILVPLLFSVPSPAYQSAPRWMIGGILAKVSTLLILVGFPQSPGGAREGG